MMQNRAADIGTASSVGLYLGSYAVTDLLQLAVLILGFACGVFSLYFHIKRFRSERKG